MRHRYVGWAALFALMALGVQACGGSPLATPDRGDIKVVYDHIEDRHEAAVNTVRQAKVLENAAADVNSRVRLRRNIWIEVTDDLPKEVDAASFLPANRTLFIPASFIDEVSHQMAGPEAAAVTGINDPAALTVGSIRYVTYRELGLILTQQFILPVPGGGEANEKAADDFAALMTAQEGAGAVPADASVLFIHLSGQPKKDVDEQRVYAKENGLNAERLRHFACIVLGSNPTDFRTALVDTGPVPAADAGSCPQEFAAAAARWNRYMRPYVRAGAPPFGTA